MRTLDILLKSHFSSFSKEEWDFLREQGIINGYGARQNTVIRFLIAKLAPMFRESNANIHDLNYFIGGTEADRIKADEGFFIRLIRDSFQTGWKIIYYFWLSMMFYGAVRLFGKKHFNYKKW